jgi:hypothetical protein
MIERARRVPLRWMPFLCDPHDLAADERGAREWAVRNHDHMKVCSCELCGNPRRLYGPTLQELRHLSEEAGWSGARVRLGARGRR